MFNIRSLVNRISLSKDGENNDTSSPARSRTSSSDPQGGYDRAVAVEAEGFLCPACMEAFLTPEDLMAHYEVCKIRLENAAALEDHMAQNYSPRDNEMVTALSEERWRSEELRKEVAMLQEQLTSKSASEESRMYQQQLRALQEAKSLLTSEVVLLRKQLTDSLESTLSLRQERDRLEERAGRHSQSMVQLQSSLDETLAWNAAQRESIERLEAQLAQHATVDDAEMLQRELAKVQLVMDQTVRDRELELDEVRRQRNDLREQNEQLKKRQNGDLLQAVEAAKEDLMKEVTEARTSALQLVDQLDEQKRLVHQTRLLLDEKSQQMEAMAHGREETDACLSELRAEVDSLQEMLHAARDSAHHQATARDDQLVRLRVDLAASQQTIDRLEETTKRLQDDNSQLMARIEEGDGANAAIDQLRQERTRLEQQLDTERLDREQLQRRLGEQKAQLDAASAGRQELQKERDDLKARLECERLASQDQQRQLKDRQLELEARLEQLSDERGRLEDRLLELDDQNREQSAALDASLAERQQLQRQVGETQQRLDGLQAQLDDADAQLGTARRDARALEELHAQAQADWRQREQLHVQEKSQLQLEYEQEQLRSQEGRQEVERQAAAAARASERAAALQESLTEREAAQRLLQERLERLEPLPALLDAEKAHRERLEQEWRDQCQMLQGEKESLTTLTSHQQVQMKELAEEHRIHLQRLRNEVDAAAREKQQLGRQLEAEKAQLARQEAAHAEQVERLQQEAQSARHQVALLEQRLVEEQRLYADLDARCDSLQAAGIDAEARLTLQQEEAARLRTRAQQSETELERLKLNSLEIRRRLEDSQAALHELGRENQSLQMDNAKLQGRKWADDSEVRNCLGCQREFTLTVRKHHCRNCGQIFCSDCSARATAVGASKKPVRVCDSCFKELSSPE